jgi:hypothetical protein
MPALLKLDHAASPHEARRVLGRFTLPFTVSASNEP